VVISLIALTIVFEKLHHTLEEKARATMHGLGGVVDALMGELTVLGPPLPSPSLELRQNLLAAGVDFLPGLRAIICSSDYWLTCWLSRGLLSGRFHWTGFLCCRKGGLCKAVEQANFYFCHRVPRGVGGGKPLRRGRARRDH
jgi:hypothetical protein